MEWIRCCWFLPYTVFMVIVDTRTSSVIVGVEAEAEVCCSEETTIIHRRRQLAVERLPVGWLELVGSLLVQVRSSQTRWFCCMNCDTDVV